MSKKNLIFGIALLSLAACGNSQKAKENYNVTNSEISAKEPIPSAEIPFTEMQNYFAKIKTGLRFQAKIVNETDFNKLLGMGTTMNANQKPTAVDFDKSYVLTVVLAETNTTTIIKPISLTKSENGTIVFEYKIEEGASISYKMKPMLAIAVDKTYEGNGEVIFTEQH